MGERLKVISDERDIPGHEWYCSIGSSGITAGMSFKKLSLKPLTVTSSMRNPLQFFKTYGIVPRATRLSTRLGTKMGKKLEENGNSFRHNVSFKPSQKEPLLEMARLNYGDNFSLLMRDIVDYYLKNKARKK